MTVRRRSGARVKNGEGKAANRRGEWPTGERTTRRIMPKFSPGTEVEEGRAGLVELAPMHSRPGSVDEIGRELLRTWPTFLDLTLTARTEECGERTRTFLQSPPHLTYSLAP